MFCTSFPESLAPSRFDYYFSSHQFWHCFVVLAAYLHYVAVEQLWAATALNVLDNSSFL